MKQAHKKRSPRATANSPPGLPDMGEIILFLCTMKAMWHIQREEFKRLKSGSSALNILYQEGCTYVMDNHLAAGWC